MKYILITGGVISGVGKGIIASSIGVILKSHGIRVSAIKIDPYLNIDAGTFSPYEHGEVFVLDDGGEVDLDLGNYERFLGVKLRRDNNITTGKIYEDVIKRERRGDYLGKTVQVVPHITDRIQEWVETVAAVPVDGSNEKPQACIVELGGTIGDIEGMAFVEAFRQMQFRCKKENFINVHVSLVPEPRSTGEQKTKPTQASVRELRGLGLVPDLIVCRSETPLIDEVRKKISLFCDVPCEQVICVHDVPSVYHVPILLYDQGVLKFLSDTLKLPITLNNPLLWMNWKELVIRYDKSMEKSTEAAKICLVGKYVKLDDAYASLIKALSHAALNYNKRLELTRVNSEDLEESTKASNPEAYQSAWRMVQSSKGVIVPGGFGERGIEGMIAVCTWCRNNKVPYLGVCLGMQCAAIEFARSMLKLKDANSTEFDKQTQHPVVFEMPEHHTGQLGGTMRLGSKKTEFMTQDSVIRKLYGDKDYVQERHRHRYEINPKYISQFKANGFNFVGQDVDKERMEIFELRGHPYYVGVQFHPEYLSHPLKPSAPYVGLILAAVNMLKPYMDNDLCSGPKNSLTVSSAAINIRKVPTMNKLTSLLHNNGHAACNGWQKERACSTGYLSSSL